ncbi:hypothetical protein Y032_0051g2144 [Ancylostoma ceylanicum]|uniref:Uncharacterized protein n=1 Tax=Ancylostoma ceylanicum TaxID=53326 RepID=A0A016U7L7_9BILA|nr:hypothetical protein Y032_0051g2144 [Ancylostoma ceylanicum]
MRHRYNLRHANFWTMRRSEAPILVILLVAIFCLLSLHNYPSSHSAQVQITDGEPDPRVKGQFEEWKECLQRNITLYQMDAKGLWANLWKGVKLCEKLPFMNDLKIENFNNGDETKRHIPSLQVSCLPPIITEI